MSDFNVNKKEIIRGNSCQRNLNVFSETTCTESWFSCATTKYVSGEEKFAKCLNLKLMRILRSHRVMTSLSIIYRFYVFHRIYPVTLIPLRTLVPINNTDYQKQPGFSRINRIPKDNPDFEKQLCVSMDKAGF